jgi:hypothetical protein
LQPEQREARLRRQVPALRAAPPSREREPVRVRVRVPVRVQRALESRRAEAPARGWEKVRQPMVPALPWRAEAAGVAGVTLEKPLIAPRCDAGQDENSQHRSQGTEHYPHSLF